jgi:DNA-binding NarL/FixJ family response regulator
MAERRRNSSVLPLTSARLIDILDRVYDLGAAERDWLHGIGEVIRPHVDCGAGVNVYIRDTRSSMDVESTRVGLGHDIEAMWTQFLRVVPFAVLSEEELRAPLSNAALCTSPRVRRFAVAGHAAMGVRSLTGINGTDLEHRTVSIGVPAPIGGRAFWPEHDRTSWERISAHLGAAFRMRNSGVARKAPDVVIDAGGRLQHAERDLASHADLAQLRQAIAAVDRARRIRMSPEAVLGAWRALYGGRWSIVASVERDGRRLLVARPNAPLCHDEHASTETRSGRPPANPRPLSAQERRVLAALAEGHSNKLIGYELGLAISTVSTLLARAARKLGCKSRIELTTAARDIARQSASAPTNELA